MPSFTYCRELGYGLSFAEYVSLVWKYEGRSVNKLQNGVILLIFRLWKFRNIHFVGDVILSMTVWAMSFITMTSLWRHL